MKRYAAKVLKVHFEGPDIYQVRMKVGPFAAQS